jgi:protein-S-isoprenylcysteine O-methyltransferase Ste14
MLQAALNMIIRFLAVISGFVVILAPLAAIFRSSGRPKGRTIGSGSVLRRWPAVAAITIGFVAVGVFLWKPIPVELSAIVDVCLIAFGSLLYFPAVGIYLWAFATLGKEFGVSTSTGADVYTNHHLIQNGPYQYIRHPMYIAVILAAMGGLLIFRTWAMVVFLPMTLVVIRRANHEELLLAEEFTDEWREYVEKVPKWIPDLTK